MDVRINKTPVSVPVDVATWGDLLDWIETQHLKAGQCITHVYMGGTETVAYRNRLTCEQEIDTVGNIAIESGDFDTVVRESLQELESELNNALTSTRQIVRLLEIRREEEAYARLGILIDSIRVFFTIFSEDLGWSDTKNSEISRQDVSAALDRAMTQLIAAQENRYWVSICDVLESEITPILESWQKLVESTCVHIS
jgi:hypothetical protein